MTEKLPLTAVRLRDRMREVGVTQDDLADSVGATQSAISQILTGKTTNSRYLPKLASALAVNLNWLLGVSDEKIDMFDSSGEQIREDQLAAMIAGHIPLDLKKPAQVSVADISADKRPAVDERTVEIPVIDLAYGMGGTFLDDFDPRVRTEPFPLSFIRRYTSAKPDMLVIAEGLGDSMIPTIGSNDQMLIDRSADTIRVADQIWAFSFGGVGMVKRLRPRPDGSVAILSDNPAVPEDRAVDDELFLIGRVVAVVRKV